MVHGIGGNNPIFNVNITSRANHSVKANEVKTSQPIDMVNNKPQIDRKDLDNISPYADLVNFTKPKAPEGSVDYYMQAEPIKWGGNFTLTDDFRDEAVSTLGAYAQGARDYAEVAPHLQNGPFAELFG